MIKKQNITNKNDDMKGIKISVFEAIKEGIPIIATRHASILDLIIENQTELLVNERNV